MLIRNGKSIWKLLPYITIGGVDCVLRWSILFLVLLLATVVAFVPFLIGVVGALVVDGGWLCC